MRNATHFAATLFLTLSLACAGGAAAAGPDAPPTPTGAAKASVGQIAAPATSAIDVQQAPAAGSNAVSAQQLSPMLRAVDAPSGPATVAEGRETRVAPIKG